jgi:hypothetical protein
LWLIPAAFLGLLNGMGRDVVLPARLRASDSS